MFLTAATAWRRGALAILVAAGVAHASAPVSAETLTIHTEAWEDYTEADGTGFAWDILRAVYEPAGVALEIDTMPYARAVAHVTRGRADAWVASYRGEVDEVVYPRWHFDADAVEAVMRPELAAVWDGPETLADRPVAWIRGYRLNTYLDVPMRVTRLDERDSAIRMIDRGRIDAFLDAAFEVERLMANLPDGLSADGFARRHLVNLPLFMAYAPTEKGRRMAALWDTRFETLLKSGRIAEIYDKHDMKVWPFEVPRDGDRAAGGAS